MTASARHMRRAVKMVDVAREAGVSPMTVSRAFRRDGSVSADTRARILRAADRLGYVLDSTASTLRSQRTGFVAVTLPSMNNANFADTFEGLAEGLASADLQPLLCSTGYLPDGEEDQIARLLHRRPEALVVTGGQHTRRTRSLLRRAGAPVVEIWDLPARPLGHVVGFSNSGAMEEIVDHLVSLGHERLAFIGGEDGSDLRGLDRRAGVLRAAARHGLPRPTVATAGRGPVTMQGGREAMARLLDNGPSVDAVVCVSDPVAFGALAECRHRGVDVPGQLSITGFGAFDIASVASPSLTTIDVSAREIGVQAASILVRALRGPKGQSEQERITVPISLRPGGSTAARVSPARARMWTGG